MSIERRYFIHHACYVIKKSSSLAHGATMRHLTKKVFENLPFFYPNLSDQTRIAKRLDLIQKQISNLNILLKKLDSLIKSRFTEMFGSIKTNPKKWKMIPLEDVAPICYLPIPSRGTVWQLNLDVIEPNSGLVSSKHYVNATEIKGSVGGFGQSQVLYSKLRPYLNKVVMPDEQGVCTTELLPLSPKKELLNRSYLTAVLRNSEFVSFANAHSNGAKMPRVDMNAFKAFEIPLPPLDYQEVFADFVIQVDKLKFETQQSIEKLQMLYDSLAQEYFAPEGD